MVVLLSTPHTPSPPPPPPAAPLATLTLATLPPGLHCSSGGGSCEHQQKDLTPGVGHTTDGEQDTMETEEKEQQEEEKDGERKWEGKIKLKAVVGELRGAEDGGGGYSGCELTLNAAGRLWARVAGCRWPPVGPGGGVPLGYL
ncbi:hypothetical protein ACOMHN_063620 [Nucella lapillus]